MKTQTFTIGMILILLLSHSVSAEHVSKDDAAVVGKNYYWEQCQSSLSLKYDQVGLNLFSTKSLDGVPVYHIFNINGNNGFIIVSADDNVTPVLGYSANGKWTGDYIPPALEQMLGVFQKQIAEVISNSIVGPGAVDELWNKYRNFAPPAPDTKSVSPLLSTTWDQGVYYNNQCPTDPLGPGGHAYAGCVAVSMAQVMHYYQHPAQGVGANSYVHPVYGTISANFGAAAYNYSMMPGALTTYNAQVAQLLFHCGVSVDMNYGPYGSAPMGLNWYTDIVNALKNNFSYSSGLLWKWKNNYQMATWISMLKSELDLGRPLIYYGWDGNQNGSSHNFNCDGYDNNSNFHFNWGWSGYYNGYYAITNLNPAPGYDFTYYQGAVFGMTPSQQNYDWGDAPDNPGYPTLAASNGASHQVPSTPTLFLGYLIDAEADGQPHVNCVGDDNNNLDDEDGVVFPTLSQGATVNITVTAVGSGLLDAWMDFNQDGDWADAGEQIFSNKTLTNGTNLVTLSIPASANIGWTYTRFRYSSQGNLSYTGQASDGEVEDYFVRIEEETQGTTDRYMLFSVDIGSDVEQSDPVLDGDEALDPGDAYLHPGTYFPMPGTDGFFDDVQAFGMDPFPDGGVPGTGAPCLNGQPIQQLKNDFFDLDGIDLTLCDLRDYPFGEGMPPVEQFDDDFIHNADSLYISYDDDDFMPYPDPTGSIPHTGFSTTGMLYGQTQTKDEVMEVDVNIVYPLGGYVVAINPKYDEATIHPNLAPNPDINSPMPNDHDDDVDALDVPFNLDDLARTYFSADHEAVYLDAAGIPLNPGSIYLAANGQAFEVINAQTDIGLFPGTDIDAFEFTWLEYPDPDYNYLSLAMIFSVDEDDPSTPEDESGGLLPNAIYVTWMTGWWFDLIPEGFMDDIDAITIVPVTAQIPKADFSPVNSMIYAGQVVNFTDLSTGGPTSWSWTFTGGNPGTFNGSTPPAVVYNNPGTYPVSLTVSNANGSDTKTGTVQVMPANWQHIPTNLSHLITIPLSVNPIINGNPLAAGDMIGIFYHDFNGIEHCGGYAVWDAVNNISVAAYGDDLTTPVKDGFANGEPLAWKVFTYSDMSEHAVSVTYDPTLPNWNGNYADFGISALTGLTSNLTQTIPVFQGWSGISSNIVPLDTNLDSLLAPIKNQMEILQNFNGVYWPSQNINNLINWNVNEGYCVKMNQDAILNIQGTALTNRTINLSAGWHTIPVLSSSTVLAANVLVDPGIMLVKEIAGNGVYWPAMNINTLNILKPGKAYYMLATANVTLNFPAKASSTGGATRQEVFADEAPWDCVDPTPASHLIVIPGEVAAQFNQGDVIGAFNSNGLNVGRAVLTGDDVVIAAYGDDLTTPESDGLAEGEPITYKLYRSTDAGVTILNPGFDTGKFDDGSAFVSNGMSVMNLKTAVEASGLFSNIDVYPNPASVSLKINFNDNSSAGATIELISIMGEVVIKTFASAATETIDVSALAEGCYMLRISGNNVGVTKKIVIRK